MSASPSALHRVYFCSINLFCSVLHMKGIAQTTFLPFCARRWWKHCGAPVLLHRVGGHRSQGEAKKARIPWFPLPLFTRLRCCLHVLSLFTRLPYNLTYANCLCLPYINCASALHTTQTNFTFLSCSKVFFPWVARHRRHKRVPASDLTIQSGPAGTWQ